MANATALPDYLLQRLWLYVNFECNLSCTYCVTDSTPSTRRPRMDVNLFRSIVDEAEALGLRQLAVTGGEPFLHPDISKMLRYAAEKSDTIVLTNATLLTPRRLDELEGLQQGNLTLQVSLDAARPERHDQQRGSGSWQRTVRGLDSLLARGHRLAVRATVTDQNESEIDELHAFLHRRGLGGRQAHAMPVVRAGRSSTGLEVVRANLLPELAVAADGLYWHPLAIAPSQAVCREVMPLTKAVQSLAEAAIGVAGKEPARAYR